MPETLNCLFGFLFGLLSMLSLGESFFLSYIDGPELELFRKTSIIIESKQIQ